MVRGGSFDMTPPYASYLGGRPAPEPPHKAHHHYYGWGNSIDNKTEPDGSRAGFNKYGNALKYCNDIHNKASSINSKKH